MSEVNAIAVDVTADTTVQDTPATNANVSPVTQQPQQRTRWAVNAPGALAALIYLSQHTKALQAGEFSFIPASDEADDYISNVILCLHKPTEKNGLWEGGGSCGKYGGAMIVAGPEGNPLVPLLTFRSNPDWDNGKHALLPVTEDSLMTLAAFENGDAMVLVFRCTGIDYNLKESVAEGKFVLIQAFLGDPRTTPAAYTRKMDIELTEGATYQKMIGAAWGKVNKYLCKHAMWIFPWRVWRSNTRPLAGQPAKEWELPADLEENGLQRIQNTGLGDPEAKFLYSNFDKMVADMEELACSTCSRLNGRAKSSRGPNLHVVIYFTPDAGDKIRITYHLIASDIRPKSEVIKTFIFVADPNDDTQACFHLNNRKPISWKSINSHIAAAGAAGRVRIVSQYVGT